MERIKKALERARELRPEQADSPLKKMREAASRTEPVQSDQMSANVAKVQPDTSSAPPPESPVLKPEQVAALVEPVARSPLPSESVQSGASGTARESVDAPERDKFVKRPKGSASHQKSAVASKIEYTQTRSVEISADLLESNRVIAGIKDHPQSDLFRVLRTKILHRMRVDKINSLAITSPTKGAGKSMVAANLAVSLAMEANQTVILVDLDLRKPAISRYFGFDAQQGVSDYLLEGAELPGLLFQPGIDRLVILPAGNPVPQSSELLSTPRMAHLVEDITNRYATRIVVFDLPPLLHLDDALIFLPQVKSSLLVVEEGVNTPAEIEQSLLLLEKSNMLGTVYNKARLARQLPY
ncbi:MAG: polysaccharide biosynthesis tyrosine autokinase [Gammaproteobacteria bacterium]|nr:polysaccharide biosynthesis tyrosine autokinase [Gammaproteobacteria bacterium]HXK56789.1 polysaccharide biosynthesis tyrosine autokinase [Gammaproteobacteria bacterium]